MGIFAISGETVAMPAETNPLTVLGEKDDLKVGSSQRGTKRGGAPSSLFVWRRTIPAFRQTLRIFHLSFFH